MQIRMPIHLLKPNNAKIPTRVFTGLFCVDIREIGGIITSRNKTKSVFLVSENIVSFLLRTMRLAGIK